MSPFDPKKPSTGVEANSRQVQELTTTNGVKVIVNPPPPERKRRRRQQEDAAPPVAVFPPGQSEQERADFLDGLARRHGAFIDQKLAARGGLSPASADDVRQLVLIIFCDHVRTTGELPDNEEGFIVRVIEKVVLNHKSKKKAVPVGVPDSGALVDGAPDPEEAAARAELRAKLDRYLGTLPAPEAEVVRAALEGMTLDDISKTVGRPKSTVEDQLVRAREKLRDLARASARAAELALRRSRAASPAGPRGIRAS